MSTHPDGRLAARRRPLVVSVTAGVLAGLLALLLSGVLLARQTPTWTADLPLLVQPAPDADPDLRASYYEILISGEITSTYAELLDDDRTLAFALVAAGLPASDAAVAAVSVTAVPGTTLLQVSATDATAQQATRVADAVARDAQLRIEALADPFVLQVPGPGTGLARQQERALPGLLVIALTAAGAVGLAVQQVVLRLERARERRAPGGGAPAPQGAAAAVPVPRADELVGHADEAPAEVPRPADALRS